MTSQFFSDVIDAVFVVDYFSVGVDVIQWRLLRHDQENLLQRHCDGVCSETRKSMSFCKFESLPLQKMHFTTESHLLPI